MNTLLTKLNSKKSFLAGALLGAFCLGYPKLFSFGYIDGILTVAALVLFSALTDRAEAKRDYLFLYFAFALGYTCRFYGLIGKIYFDIPIGLLLSAAVFPLFIFSKVAARRMHAVISVFVFPFLWLAEGLLFGLLRIPAAMRLDWLFFDMKYFIQSASLVTVYGFTFLILLIVGFIAVSIRQRRLWGLFTALGIAGLMTGYGVFVLNTALPSENSITVAYTTGPYCGDFMDYFTVDYDTQLEVFDSAVRTATESDAAILVFTEEAFDMSSAAEEAYFIEHVCASAGSSGLHILVGLDTVSETDTKRVNKLVWADSSGKVKAEYIKYNTIPLIESDYIRGDGTIPTFDIEVDGQEIGVAFAICYDSNSPNYIAGIKDSTDILFLPSWDWDGVTEYHYRLVGCMAVQCGFSVIKPTYDGYTVVCDKFGHVVQRTDTAETGFGTVQTVEIPF